jgi:PAS domain S-box-containing protein/putative nucleotidyltransferase with HDIG domain
MQRHDGRSLVFQAVGRIRMKQTAISEHSLAVRIAAGVGLLLIILFLAMGGARHASPLAIIFLSVLAGLSAACLVVAQYAAVVRRDADATVLSLRTEREERTGPLTAELARADNRHRDVLDHMLAGGQVISFDWRYVYVNDAVARQGRMAKDELLGRTMMECYPGIERTPLFATLEHCMKARATEYLETEFTHNDGTPGWFELSIQPVPEGIFIVSIDITDRKLAEIKLRRQVERLHALRSIDLAILSTTDLSFTLHTVLEQARASLRVDGACIRFLNPQSLELEIAAAAGIAPERGVAVHINNGVVGRVVRERKTIEIPDTGMHEGPTHVSTKAGAIYSTPLIAKGSLTGTLTVTFNQPFHAERDWVEYFETVAGQASMAIENGKMFDELQRSHLDLRLAYETTIEGWSRALDLRDKETEGHTQRVTELTVKLARKAGLSENEILHIRRGALLHDIGKMGVPDQILLKPGALTDEEWVLMRRHPTYAYELLRPIGYLREALDIPYCHHEKWDGTGYPRGLKGDQIPLAARLFAVVDVWDAIRSDRPYRSGWDEERALQFIRSVSGTHFDPRAVGFFLKVYEESKREIAEPVGAC